MKFVTMKFISGIWNPTKEMATYLDQVIPEEKIPLIKSGFARLMWINFFIGLVTGIIIGLCF